MEKKPVIVSFSSIKGGVGKTHIAILLAACAASACKKVLLIDSDLNNSLSYQYLSEETLERTRKLNIASALSDESNDLSRFAVATQWEGIDLIASTPHLSDLRTLSEKRLKRMTPSLDGKYDIVIIDCHPTYDNIVLNALHASDFIITPVLKDLFSYNAAVYLNNVLPRDIEDNYKNWFVLLNGYTRHYEEARGGRQSEYIKIYEEARLPLTPRETWIPWTAQMRDIVDYKMPLSRGKVKGAVCNRALFDAVTSLAGCFFEEELSVKDIFGVSINNKYRESIERYLNAET
jgi:chromosome partitioning protein